MDITTWPTPTSRPPRPPIMAWTTARPMGARQTEGGLSSYWLITIFVGESGSSKKNRLEGSVSYPYTFCTDLDPGFFLNTDPDPDCFSMRIRIQVKKKKFKDNKKNVE